MPAQIEKIKNEIGGRWRQTARWLQWTIIILAVLLVAMRLALPWAIKSYVNHHLSKISDYSGRVENIRVHLWRGAYEIDRISINKTEGKIPVPFFFGFRH